MQKSVAAATTTLTERVTQLESRNIQPAPVVPIHEANASPPESSFDMLAELHDRQTRANNLLFFNVPESENDYEQVCSIHEILLGSQSTICKVTRFGKPNSKNARPIRAVLNSAGDVQSTLRSGYKLKGKPFLSVLT